jgi:hypothetical protein
MIVYRVARTDGEEFPVGPYRFWGIGDFGTPSWVRDMGWAHNTDNEHPPTEWIDSAYVCAFDSDMGLLQWFDGWLDHLDRDGFRVYEYECPDKLVEQAGNQVVVPERHLKEIRNYPINPEIAE